MDVCMLLNVNADIAAVCVNLNACFHFNWIRSYLPNYISRDSCPKQKKSD